MICGIYVITNKINNKEYYGKSVDVKNRMKRSHHDCPVIVNAIKKYGEENFDRHVIIYCEEWELARLEIACIKIFHSHVSEGGYNVTYGGEGSKGFKHTKESLEKMSGKNNHNYGKSWGKEQRKKASISHINMTDKTKRLISLNHFDNSGINHYRFGHKSEKTSSKYFGIRKNVSKYTEQASWRVTFRENKKPIGLGTFKTELQAAMKYDEYIRKNNLPNPLNFPTENDFLSLPFYKNWTIPESRIK
jgi:group I intron endonuclease